MAERLDPSVDWTRHRLAQEARFGTSTPAQRFAWLEQAWLFVWHARRADRRSRPPSAPPAVVEG